MLDREQEDRVLSYLLHQNLYSELLYPVLPPHFFSDNGSKALFNTLRDLYLFRKVSGVPTKRELLSHLKKFVSEQSELVQEAYANRILAIYDIPTTEATWAEIQDVLVNHHVSDLASQSSSRKGSKSALKALRETTGLLSPIVEPGDTRSGCDFLSSDFMNCRMEIFKQPDLAETIQFGYPLLDQVTGGLLRGDLAMLFAYFGVGKSITLMNLALKMLKNGYRVFYADTDNEQRLQEKRFYACLTKQLSDDFGHASGWADNRPLVEDAAGQINYEVGNFWYQPVSPLETSVAELENKILKKDRDTGKPYDVVLVDYGEDLRPNFMTQERRLNEEQVFRELRALAKRTHKGVIAASQANAKALQEGEPGLDHIGEAKGKGKPCALVMSLNQTPAEKTMDPPRARLTLLKVRDGPSNLVISYLADFARASFEEDPDWQLTTTAERIMEAKYNKGNEGYGRLPKDAGYNLNSDFGGGGYRPRRGGRGNGKWGRPSGRTNPDQ